MDRFHTFPGAASPCVVSSDYMVIVHPFQILPRSIVGIRPFPRCVARRSSSWIGGGIGKSYLSDVDVVVVAVIVVVVVVDDVDVVATEGH